MPEGLHALAKRVQLDQVSPWYRSPAVGFAGPDFINLVVRCRTDLSLTELVVMLKKLEREFGRAPNATKYSSRALDLDILLYDDLVGQFGGQTLPRSDIWRFAFVLKPLLDIAPQLMCPLRRVPVASYWPVVADQPLKPMLDEEPALLAVAR